MVESRGVRGAPCQRGILILHQRNHYSEELRFLCSCIYRFHFATTPPCRHQHHSAPKRVLACPPSSRRRGLRPEGGGTTGPKVSS